MHDNKYPEHYENLLEYFKNTFWIPIPFDIPSDLEECDFEFLLVRNVDKKDILGLLHPKFIETARDGAYIIGAWGHGINSYRFVLQFADRKGKFFFEGAVEGVYDPHPETEQETLKNLLELLKIHKHLEQMTSSYEIGHSYGGGRIEYTLKSGKKKMIKLGRKVSFSDFL